LARRKFEKLDDEVLKKRFGKTFYRWDYDNSVLRDEERMEDTLFAMMAMREKAVLRFDTLAHYAETDWLVARNPNLCRSSTDLLCV
jgi:hypothetical protein